MFNFRSRLMDFNKMSPSEFNFDRYRSSKDPTLHKAQNILYYLSLSQRKHTPFLKRDGNMT